MRSRPSGSVDRSVDDEPARADLGYVDVVNQGEDLDREVSGLVEILRLREDVVTIRVLDDPEGIVVGPADQVGLSTRSGPTVMI